MLRTARRLLAQGDAGDGPLQRQASVGRPVPVVGTDGELDSWFVPVTLGDRLGGYFRFTAAGDYSSFSAFPRRGARFDDCPLAADWLDAGRIAARAEPLRRRDETAAPPFLSYDGTPERLAWAVSLTRPDGSTRIVFVAGTSVFTQRQDDSVG
jgi:hypothetical protein